MHTILNAALFSLLTHRLISLVDKRWTSERTPDPLGRLLSVLDGTRDRALLQRWGLWLVRRDAQRGLHVIMAARELARGLPKSIAENADLAVLRQIAPPLGSGLTN